MGGTASSFRIALRPRIVILPPNAYLSRGVKPQTDRPGTDAMDKHELRAVSSLAAVFSVRLLGLFMIYPVFSAYAKELSGATPYKIGLALGIYGLSQGILQIPFGMLSDKIGRKILIIAGLAIFGIGSVVAALSTSIDGVIAGAPAARLGRGRFGDLGACGRPHLRAEPHQGHGDGWRHHRLSFMVALVAGPIIASFAGVQGIFWLMVVLALARHRHYTVRGAGPARPACQRDAETVPAMLASVLKDRELLRLDFGTFVQNAMLTASFLVVPGLLHSALNVTTHDQWMVYLPVLVVSLLVTVPAIIAAEKYRLMKAVFVGAVAALAASQILLVFAAQNLYALLAALTVFFAGFNVMAATLPSLITKTAPPDAKGTATGIYSSSQFMGFSSGVRGRLGASSSRRYRRIRDDLGACPAMAGRRGYDGTAELFTTRLVRLGCPGSPRGKTCREPASNARRRRGCVIAEEKLAYLKVDAKAFDAAKAEALAGAS